MLESQPLSVAKLREVDRRARDEYHLPTLVLMENAARGCVDLLLQESRTQPLRITILCGKGNNAGDGLAMARHLELRGHQPQVLLTLGDDFHGDALTNYEICRASRIPLLAWQGRSPNDWQRVFTEQDWIVDALLGTGATGPPRPPLDTVIQLANSCAGVRRFAVDTPTGLNCDSGTVADNCFQADVTATFVARKVGFAEQAAQAVLGRVQVLDIGAPRHLLADVIGQ